ncbi:MAG: 2-amino-4-hydroxy-6-hydroxymethyldihydropteridine diphosphokinase [Ferruginibacter sp.]
MNLAYILLGSNIGDSKSLLITATKLIAKHAGEIKTCSSIYRTSAWGNENQDDFLNQVILIQTKYSAQALLDILLETEKKMGRSRTIKNAPRLIDLDILFFNHDIINDPELVVPHPLMEKRRFVLVPLKELNPLYLHPILNKTIQQLLLECPDKLDVKKN